MDEVIASQKSLLVALLLSIILPGLGQIYLGLTRKGYVLIVLYVGFSAMVLILLLDLIGICFMPVLLVIWLYAVYDVYRCARKARRGEVLKDWLS